MNDLPDVLRALLRHELEHRQRLGDRAAPHDVGDEPGLPRRDVQILRSCSCFHGISPLPLFGRRALDRFAAAVSPEMAGWRELAELMPDHVLGHVNRHVPATIVDRQGMPNHLREDGRIARPGLDHALFSDAVEPLNLFEQANVDVGTLLCRTGHTTSCELIRRLLPTPDDETTAGLILLASLVAKRGLAPGGLRTRVPNGRLAFATAVGMVAGRHRRA